MHILRIEHRVLGYDRWKEAFDRDPADRLGSGVTGYRVQRDVSNPDFVLIDLEFDSREAAEAMHTKLLGVWEGPGREVMLEPQARLVELTEARSLT